jgi:hypothetical protein
VCAAESVLLSDYLPFVLLWFNTSCFLCFHLLCAEFLVETSVVEVVLVSVFHERFLLLH